MQKGAHRLTILRKIGGNNGILVSCKRLWSETFEWVECKEARGHVSRCCKETPDTIKQAQGCVVGRGECLLGIG